MYKVTTISTERSFTFEGRTFTTACDLCNAERGLMTFDTFRDAEQAAREYATKGGFRYLEIGDIDTPALGETFVEVRLA